MSPNLTPRDISTHVVRVLWLSVPRALHRYNHGSSSAACIAVITSQRLLTPSLPRYTPSNAHCPIPSQSCSSSAPPRATRMVHSECTGEHDTEYSLVGTIEHRAF